MAIAVNAFLRYSHASHLIRGACRGASCKSGFFARSSIWVRPSPVHAVVRGPHQSARNIFHSKMTIPVKPGAFTLVYPKWIPGNHRPSGPIANFTGLRIEASGKPVAWQRDDEDMYAFHVDVPPGVSEITVFSDTITIDGSAGASGPSASSTLLDLNWNQVVLYPAGAASDDVQVTASVRLPPDWKYYTSLPPTRPGGDTIVFQPVSLTTLVDSPLIAGQHLREILLKEPGKGPLLFLDLVGESEAAIDVLRTAILGLSQAR